MCLFLNLLSRVPFTFFLLVMGVNSMFTIFFMWEVVRQTGADIFVYFGILLFCVFFVSGVIQTVLLVITAFVIQCVCVYWCNYCVCVHACVHGG